MFRKALWLIACIVFSVVVTACSRSDNKQSSVQERPVAETSTASPHEGPPADVVQASTSGVELTMGGSGEASIIVKIANGYHINGNPASKYQIATTLDTESDHGIIVGTPLYPQAVSKKFSFANEQIMVYESEVVIKQPLQAGAGSPTRLIAVLRAKLRVQPCDDTVCYPPRTLEVSIPVSVE